MSNEVLYSYEAYQVYVAESRACGYEYLSYDEWSGKVDRKRAIEFERWQNRKYFYDPEEREYD